MPKKWHALTFHPQVIAKRNRGNCCLHSCHLRLIGMVGKGSRWKIIVQDACQYSTFTRKFTIARRSLLANGPVQMASQLEFVITFSYPQAQIFVQSTETMRLTKTFRERSTVCDGSATPRKDWAHCLIKTASFEAQLIADMTEGNFGFMETTRKVNDYRTANRMVCVGSSCVYLTSKRLKPVVTTIKKRQQGSLDINSGWCCSSN